MPLLLPLMAVIAIGIKVVSRGPVLFRQQRIGYLGVRFDCLKFRTMKWNANTGTHEQYFKELIASNKAMTKMDAQGDPRLIPFGSLLRASGLDELPQIFNVLRGEMSLVGPRPCVPKEYENYLPWHKARLKALPGLTGLWQVSGKNKTTFEQMIDYDIRYARTQSLSLDLKILFLTGPVLFSQIRETIVKNGRKAVSSGGGDRKDPSQKQSNNQPNKQEEMCETR